MFSGKDNVNILTALLVAHGIRHAVVCPGSRNAPIVHNLNECRGISCHAVTDERSAGFYALGMAQCLDEPVVVCVTSGTALLNLSPAVAEAYYQQRQLVVVSADRPPQWIDQQDGQTLPQSCALKDLVRKAVTLVEPRNDEERWYCNRLVNEALLTRHGPVHINVPIAEPLFDFTVDTLPQERKIELTTGDTSGPLLGHVGTMFRLAKRPFLLTGQPLNPHLDEAVSLVADDERYVPDFVLYIGGAVVSKRIKHFLRKARQTWVVNTTGEVTDTFLNLTHVIQGDGEMVADHVRFLLEQQPHPFVQLWDDLLARVAAHAETFVPSYSQMAVVKCFEEQLPAQPGADGCQWGNEAPGPVCHVHYANSSAIRLANIYARHPVWCNRGVNGIEGSLSTAAGFSCVTDDRVYCVIGDLSFFYDQNALWNQELSGNLRILLMNNGGGGIFGTLPGLEKSGAYQRYVAASHHTCAEGICRQDGVHYRRATDMASVAEGVAWLTQAESRRPLLLEVTTDAAADRQVMREYYNSCLKNISTK